MQRTFRPLGLFALLLALAACNDAAAPVAASSTSAAATPVVQADAPAGNVLRMRIDGVEWNAERELFGAVHPAGYDRAVIISGSHGPNDGTEQDFTIMLNAADGPGTYRATTGDTRRHVVQLGNLTPERYLAGGLMLDHDVTIDLVRMQASPVLVEARFRGTLTANDGTVLKIEDGEFRYRE